MRVLINGAEADVSGVDKFSINKIIDREDKVIRFEYPGDLTFYEESFRYLLDARNSAYCDIVDVEIQGLCGSVFKTIIEGEIRLTNIEFNHKKCSARAKVKEKGLLARILNGWDKETSVTGGQDLYGNDISKVAARATEFRKPFDGVLYSDVNCWDWLGAVQYYVTYLSGSDLQVVSDWYDGLPSTKQISITGGLNIRTPSAADSCVVTSLETIYKDMAKMFNLYMGIVYNGNTPELRIEQESFWFSSDILVNRNQVLEIKDRYNEELLYSNVITGSATTIKGDGNRGQSFPDIPFFSFTKEKFAISGSCNLDRTLDIALDGIIDSNVIEDIIENSTDTYDEDVFYIQTEDDSGFSAYQPSGQFITGRSFFNPEFQKNEQVLNYNFQGDVRRDIDLGADQYLAYYPSAPTTPITTGTIPLAFPNDSVPPGYDTDGNFNTSNSRYTAPANDIYTFRLQILYRILQLNVIGDLRAHIYLRGLVKRYNSSGVFQDDHFGQRHVYYINGVNPFPSDVHFVRDYYDVFMQAGDYVTFNLYASVGVGSQVDDLILVSPGSIAGVTNYQFSECVTTKNAGGLIRQSNPSTYRAREFEFEDTLAVEEMIEMVRQPQKAVGFGGMNVDRRLGWGEIEANIKTGKTTFKLLSSDSD